MKGTPDLPMDVIGPCDEGTHRRDVYYPAGKASLRAACTSPRLLRGLAGH